MLRNTLCLTLLALFALTGSATAQGPLDLVPSDAMAGFAIRNLNDLKKKGDKFIKDTDLQMQFPMRPSQLFDDVYKFLGVQGAVDEDGSAAIMLVAEKVVGQPIGLQTLDKYIVGVIPFSDRDKIGAAFGLKQGELKPEKLAELQNNRLGTAKLFGYVRGKHLFLGPHDKAVVSAAKAKSVGSEMTAAQRKTLAASDMMVHLGTESWGTNWTDGLKAVQKEVADLSKDDAERQAGEDFVKALGAVRFCLCGCRIDGGLGCNCVAVFRKDDKDAKKFLTTLRAGAGASSLKGLPTGTALAAWAARGDGSKNVVTARVLFKFLLQGRADFLMASKFFSVADRPMFVGVFNEVWKRLRGSRMALYKTSDEQKLGLFSAVSILDTEDAEAFLKELRQMAKLGHGDGIDLTTEAGKEANLKDVEQLLKDLGARRFAQREAATTKLLLIGEPVLPHLEKAIKSPDLETSRRAERIKTEIVQAAEVRRKELLSGNITRAVKPSFAFLAKGEEIAGKKVTLVAVKLPKKDAAYAHPLSQLLGPEWNRVRLAVVGKQVVALIGSDVKLFEQTLKNLEDGKPGLAEAAPLREFARRSDPARKIEFHLSLEAASALATAADLEKPGKIKPGDTFSSGALTVELDRMQFDGWLPISEFKAVLKASMR
ncbi:MAG TPA: hypothetical protein VKD72_37005 [Gemmataceae bacterium]|nr:hypothetical protein [Gemmataceae bacterium]